MSEENETVNPTVDLVKAITAGDFAAAKQTFDTVMADRASGRIDQERVAVSKSIYNNDDDVTVHDYDDNDAGGGDVEEPSTQDAE